MGWVFSKFKGGMQCLKEHGLKYTMKLFFIKIAKRILPRSFWELNRVFRKSILVGYRTYNEILSKFPIYSNSKVYFMDYQGGGDTYLACSYLTDFYKITTNDIFVAPSKLTAKLASYFNFGTIIEISKEQAFTVCAMDRFYGRKLQITRLLYESLPLVYSGVLRHIQGYKGVNFMTLLRIGFEHNIGIQYNEMPWTPSGLPYNQTDADNVLSEFDFKRGHSVLIAPYAINQNRYGIPLSFYEKIVDILVERDFNVFTNSSDVIKEPPIRNTMPIFLSHELLIPFCEQGGYYIGIRCGLCDIISSGRLKRKIILYPQKRTDQGVAFWKEFFSLQNMGLCNDAQEIEFDINKQEELVKEIVQMIVQDEVCHKCHG